MIAAAAYAAPLEPQAGARYLFSVVGEERACGFGEAVRSGKDAPIETRTRIVLFQTQRKRAVSHKRFQ